VVVNLLLGFFIYSMILYTYGEKYMPNSELKDGVWCVNDITKDIGFKNGDKIVSVGGEKIDRFNDITKKMLYAESAVVERNGERVTIDIPVNLAGRYSKNRQTLFQPRMPFLISAVPDTSINADIGFKKKDRVISVNGNDIKYFDQAIPLLDSLKGQTVPIKLKRDDRVLEKTAEISDKGKLEVGVALLNYKLLDKMGFYDMKTKTYGLLASIPFGWNKAFNVLGGYIKQFKLIFDVDTGAYKGVGSFGSIGSMFPAQWNWHAFWNITAILSLILGFMNMLPIPALDGGHVMFLLFEMVSGRPPGKKVLEKAQLIGMVLLLSLMFFAISNDIVTWFEGGF
ncbi:MAG: site-2 protease family protein, partial [Flavobacteriales bacterium]